MRLGGIQVGGRGLNVNAMLMWSQSPAFLSAYLTLIPESEADTSSRAQAEQLLHGYLSEKHKKDNGQNLAQEIKTQPPVRRELYKDPKSNFTMVSLTTTRVPSDVKGTADKQADEATSVC